jgi:hypothetical protein
MYGKYLLATLSFLALSLASGWAVSSWLPGLLAVTVQAEKEWSALKCIINDTEHKHFNG